MLPTTWSSERLVCRDATLDDVPLIAQWLEESADVAALDPTFGVASEEDIRHQVQRHRDALTPSPREVQMQIIFARSAAPKACPDKQSPGGDPGGAKDEPEPIGFWRLVRVPSRKRAVGVEILLIRPAFRRGGHARELVRATLEHLRGTAEEFWARVYLANARALAFWSSTGLRRVIEHQGNTVHGQVRDPQAPTQTQDPGEGPSIILGCDIPVAEPAHAHGDALPPPAQEYNP